MHPTLKEEIFKQKVRMIHRDLLLNRKLNEQANLYTTFVQPFTDVLDSVALAGQDILNSVKLIWDTFWTLSPEKLEEANNEFLQRKGKIAEKWKPIVDRSQEALATGDAGLFLFMANPGLYLATESLGQAVNAGQSVATYLRDSGLKVPLISSVFDSGLLDDLETASSRATTISNTPPKEKSFLEKLAGLFYLENAWMQGDLILEAPDVKSTAQAKLNLNPEEEVTKYLKSTGILDQINKSAEEFQRATEQYLDKITKEEAAPKILMMKKMIEAQDLDVFLAAIDEARANGADVKVNATDLNTEILESAKQLASSEEFIEKMQQIPGNENKEEFSDDEKLKEAKRIVFINQKKNMDEQMLEGMQNLKQEIVKMIEKEEPDQKYKSFLSKSKQGVSFMKIYEDAKQFVLNL